MYKGFWSLTMAKKCIPYCGVVMWDDIHLNVHLPMGTTVAPCYFQYIMDYTLKGVNHATFLDDATIGGVSQKDMWEQTLNGFR